MALPPGPRQPGIAQLLEYTFRPLPFFDRCIANHGDLFTLRMPGLGEFVMCGSPELVKQVFTADPDTLHAGSANGIIEPLVGPRSVLLLDGPEHLRQRRLLMPPLHGERMQAYAQLIGEITNATIDRWPVGEPFSLHPHMQAITLEVIMRAVFGVDEGARSDRLRRLLVEYMKPPPSIFAFVPALRRDFPLSPYRGFLRRRAAVDEELRAIIAARRGAKGGAARTDVLSLLLAARDENGTPMTDDELRDELVTMLVAGHETTATALSWAFALVLDDAAVRSRLRGELDGARDGGGGIEPIAATRLEYLDAVVKETLRLRPILPDVVREVVAPFSIAGYDIPIGAFLTPFIYGVHRRPDLYPEPGRFRPERFVGAKADPYAWFPFGGGIRRCLGMAFALYEMKIVLGTVLARAELRLDGGPVRVVRRTLTFAPSGGTRVVLTERPRAAGAPARREPPAAATA
jgi:cytochrome P450 family 110